MEVAGQRLQLQRGWCPPTPLVAGANTEELPTSELSPSPGLLLSALSFCFLLGISQRICLFYLIEPHPKDDLSVNFGSSLVLELADGALASDVSSFSALPFHDSTLHLIRQRCDTHPEAPAQAPTTGGLFSSAFLLLELVDYVQHHIVHLPVLLLRSSVYATSSPVAMRIRNSKPTRRHSGWFYSSFSILNLRSSLGLLKLHST